MATCPLPWFKFRSASAAPEEYAVHALCAQLGAEADVYLYRLWAYCGRERMEGRFPGPGAALAVERAVRWRGRRKKLVDALLTVGLLVLEGEDLVVASWAEEQGSHIAKVLRDRAKPDGRTHGDGADSANLPRESLQPPAREEGGERGEKRRETKSPGRKAEKTTPPGRVTGAPQPPPLKAPASAPRGSSAGSVAEESLPDGVNRVCMAVKGVPYEWRPGRDDPAARELLSRGSVAEVLRRWEYGLRAHYRQRCDTISDLVKRWEANATPEHRNDTGQASGAARRADTAVGRGEVPVTPLPDTPAGRAWGQVLDVMRHEGFGYGADTTAARAQPASFDGRELLVELDDVYALQGLSADGYEAAFRERAHSLGITLRFRVAQPAPALAS
ncbi:hypothetical protein [Corallococcus macrosporus]|uniref:DnaA N-terminal domain-containing protein n=1 Tax=Myxococcus fulvus (strain ATCC BAA-855 / HW-1) TaxID=483219 RepID=F8C6K7_MYXFH|nr:hypothetical protein [Corallococcus macrosporus]AEI65596.1 hypothetical protein LILAB_18470 [Corallococcus macrosporus]